MKRRTTPDWSSVTRGEANSASGLRVLTASIAHEVNQPLSGIIMNASTCLRMLSANPPNLEGVRETARRALRDANRVAGIVRRLRALFEGTPIAMEAVDVNEAVREALDIASGDIAANHVEVTCGFAAGLPLLTADRMALLQVIENLVKNALEAMSGDIGRRRELTITTQRAGNRVLITVRDVGIGLAPEHVERLFAPFYTTKAHGMGIGLAVSRSIIEHHGGRLRARPNADSPGATFWMSLPLEFARPSGCTRSVGNASQTEPRLAGRMTRESDSCADRIVG